MVARNLKRAVILYSLQRALRTHGTFVQANGIFRNKIDQLWHTCRLSFWTKKASGCQSYVEENPNFYFYSLASFCFSIFVSNSIWNVPYICCLLIMYVLIELCNDIVRFY